ncbi:hypothetical protein AYX13_03858 [Cryptococcus neoformans]|nr:hypothetical protein AYX13_03858 [Cryptococcus neoformans var. grubii]
MFSDRSNNGGGRAPTRDEESSRVGEGEKGCWKMMMARDFFEHRQRPTELEMLMSIEDGGVVDVPEVFQGHWKP